MKWSLQELNKKKDIGVSIDTSLDLREALMARSKEILDLSPVVVKGLMSITAKEYILHYNMRYTITLPSARTLEPVPLTLSIDVDEVFQTPETFALNQKEEGMDEILIVEANTISLDESVADNILLEIPLRVLAEGEEADELPEGSFWKVISEEEYEKELLEDDDELSIDPRLAELKKLLEQEENNE